MRYEYNIGLRFLLSAKSAKEPSVIAIFTVAGIGLSVGVLIAVLAVLGGFETDLREKILGTRAHLLVTGPEMGVMENDPEIIARARQIDGVLGVSPFIETEVMISSPTSYSGMVLRGIDPELAPDATNLEESIIEGELSWLETPGEARSAQRQDGSQQLREYDDLEILDREIQRLQEEIARLREADEGGSRRRNTTGEADAARAEEASSTREERADDRDHVSLRSEGADTDADRVPATEDEEGSGPAMPELPTPQAPAADEEARAEGAMPELPAPGRQMPGLPPPRNQGANGAMPELPGPGSSDNEPEESTTSDYPGLLIGTELQQSLSVLIGDTVNLISPDGDLGPTGPIPRSRPFRIVGVFYTGYYEFDAAMGFVLDESARDLVSIDDGSITGIEVLTEDSRTTDRVALAMRAALDGYEVDVHDWRELNESLFAALELEKIAISVLVGFMIVVSALLVLIVVFMVVIAKRREVAILRSFGASRGQVVRVFMVQGAVMGSLGTVIGVIIGLSFVAVCVYIGIPLPEEVYYIDHLPVDLDAADVVLVALSSLVLTTLPTLIPALGAANLDPVEGLRDDHAV